MVSSENELSVLARAQQGNRKAQQQILDSYEHVIRAVARSYSRFIDVEDLEQEGRMGLLVAASRFDVNKGSQFKSWAELYVKQYIVECVRNHSRIVSLPQNVIRQERWRQIVEAEWYQQRKTYTMDDVAVAIGNGVDIEQLKLVKQLAEFGHVYTRIEEIHDSDHPVANVDVAEVLERKEAQEFYVALVVKLLPRLPSRERKVLKWYYGIGCESQDLVVIAKKWNVGRTRVSQIHVKAKKLLFKLVEEELSKGDTNGHA